MAKNTLVEALTVESLLPFSFLFSARSTFEAVHSGSFNEFYYFSNLRKCQIVKFVKTTMSAVCLQAERESRLRATDSQDLL